MVARRVIDVRSEGICQHPFPIFGHAIRQTLLPSFGSQPEIELHFGAGLAGATDNLVLIARLPQLQPFPPRGDGLKYSKIL